MPLSSEDLLSSEDERSQELGTIATIYPELVLLSPFSATISLPISPILPVPISFELNCTETFLISYFPPLTLAFHLPKTYPESSPPKIELSTTFSWLPEDAITRLKSEIDALWEDYGRSQTLFSVIDHIQQSAEKAFGLLPPGATHFTLPKPLKYKILGYNSLTTKSVFEQGTYDCGICLEPKKGSQCHRLRSCTHVFCRQCLQDYFSSMIKEGHVSSVACSDTTCVKKASQALANAADPPTPPHTPEAAPNRGRKAMLPPTLPPDELREIGISEELVKRYIDFKQKSALDADPGTVYCPRNWCQAPSRESIAALNKIMSDNHTSYYLPAYTPIPSIPIPISDHKPEPEAPIQKLQICSKCAFAFCRICHHSWHGDRAICRSPDAPLTAEEIANEEFLRNNTTQCPDCNTPVLKSHGCNHMICKCLTHFCFLCSAYLPPKEPYRHFNTPGTECYQRLWEGEEGDGEHVRAREEGRVDRGGEELVEGLNIVEFVEEVVPAQAERERAPFILGVVPAPQVQQEVAARINRVQRRQRIRGRFADWGEMDSDSEAEEVDFDDVPDL